MDPPAATQDDRELTEVVRSARGWNGVQLAALAFIGLCGVLSDADAATPRWVQITAGVLALLALVLACASIFLVATVAWPFPSSPGGAPDRVDAAAVRRLRHGVRLTFVAVAVMALAASGSWWPTAEVTAPGDASGASGVQITDGNGRTACGALADGPAGVIRLRTAGGVVELAIARVAAIAPAGDC